MIINNTKAILAVPTSNGSVFVEENKIICCLAEGSYTKIVLQDHSELLIAKTLNKVLEGLSQEFFIRIHKSHLVNIAHIINYTSVKGKNIVTITGDLKLTVSRSRKEAFLNHFRML